MGCALEAPTGATSAPLDVAEHWQAICYATGSAAWTEDSGQRSCVCSESGGALQKTCTQALPAHQGACTQSLTDACAAGAAPFMCDGASGSLCRCDSDRGQLACAPPTPDHTGLCGADEFLDCMAGASESCMMGPVKACTCEPVAGVPTVVCSEPEAYTPPAGLTLPSVGPGTIEPSVQTCAGSLPGQTCEVHTVTCGGEASIDVELLITPPPAGTPLRGTVLLGSGGLGDSHYGQPVIIDGLNALGFRTVERKWLDPRGWLEGEGGLASVSCRLDTVIAHLEQIHGDDGALCATGSSGGAIELELALFHGMAGYRLDFAMPTGGGVYSLPDGCFPGSAPGWQSACHQLADQYLNDGCAQVPDAYLCGLPSGSISYAYADDQACNVDDPAHRAQLAPDGLDATGLYLPGPTVSFMFGEMDCSGAATNGLQLHDAIASAGTATTLDVIPGAGHGVHGDALGQAVLLDRFDDFCVD